MMRRLLTIAAVLPLAGATVLAVTAVTHLLLLGDTHIGDRASYTELALVATTAAAMLARPTWVLGRWSR